MDATKFNSCLFTDSYKGKKVLNPFPYTTLFYGKRELVNNCMFSTYYDNWVAYPRDTNLEVLTPAEYHVFSNSVFTKYAQNNAEAGYISESVISNCKFRIQQAGSHSFRLNPKTTILTNTTIDNKYQPN